MENTTISHRSIAGQPHQDVHVLVALCRKLEPGQSFSKKEAAAAIGCNGEVLVRRMTAARKILERDYAIVISVERGEGWRREMASETVARADGREMSGMHRKSLRVGRQLAAVTIEALTPEQKTQYFTTRTINNIIYKSTTSATKQKILALAQASQQLTPMAEALRLLE